MHEHERSRLLDQPHALAGALESVLVLDRFKTGPVVTVLGALLLVVGGVLVVAHAQTVGTVVAAVGGLIVVRERIRTRQR